jgi:hypothetical protein
VRAKRLIVAVILVISIGAPIVEMFDQWDRTLEDGNDTEATMVVAALCVGLALLVATAISSPHRPLSALLDSPPSAAAGVRRITAFQLTGHATSPPKPLRI